MTDEPEKTQATPVSTPETVREKVTETTPEKPAGARATAPADSLERIGPLLTIAGFIILAGCIAYLWTRPVPEPPMPIIPPNESGVVAALKTQLAGMQDQLAALDHREKADIAALRQEISGLPAVPAGNTGKTTTTGADAAAVSALKSQISALTDQVGKLQAASAHAAAGPSAATVSALSGKIDGLAQREAADMQALHGSVSALQQKMDDLSGQTKSLAAQAGAVPKLSAEADRLGRMMQAAARLSAGQPLGTLPDAPPALTRFATTAPPTEAALRLSFPAAASAAEKAASVTAAHPGFWRGIWLRVASLVSLRQGDRVILGNPASGTIAHARALLDAGDLPGAVAILGALPPASAAAMAPWLDDARALIAARQALTQMAAR
jgi:hypothetical protein